MADRMAEVGDSDNDMVAEEIASQVDPDTLYWCNYCAENSNGKNWTLAYYYRTNDPESNAYCRNVTENRGYTGPIIPEGAPLYACRNCVVQVKPPSTCEPMPDAFEWARTNPHAESVTTRAWGQRLSLSTERSGEIDYSPRPSP